MKPGAEPIKTEIVLVRDPNKDAMVAELWAHDRMFAEMWQAEDGFQLQLYGNPTGVPWVLSLDDLTGHFEEAKRLLMARRDAPGEGRVAGEAGGSGVGHRETDLRIQG